MFIACTHLNETFDQERNATLEAMRNF